MDKEGRGEREGAFGAMGEGDYDTGGMVVSGSDLGHLSPFRSS